MNSRRSARTTFSGPSNLCLRSLRTWTQEISLGKFGSPATSIPRMLKGLSKSGENLDSSLSPAWKEILLGQISLILPDVHVVKLSGVSGLYLDLLGNFAAGVDPVALESAEDAIEAALLDPEPALQGLNHLPMCMRIFKVHIERRRVSSANSIKTSFTAPQLYAALVVRVENPL